MGCTVYCAKPVDLDKLKNSVKEIETDIISQEEKKWQKILVQTACWICICMKTDSCLNSWKRQPLKKKDADSFDEADINEFFRVMHTIKGSSGIMMFDDIMKLAHKLEDVFYFIRESKPDNVPHMELVEHIFQVSDFISAEFDKIRDGGDPDGDAKELIDELDVFLKKIKMKQRRMVKNCRRQMCRSRQSSFILHR